MRSRAFGCGLVKKHSGELVELDRMFLRREGCKPAGRMDFQFGYPGSLKEVRRSIRFQVMDMVERHGIHAVDLAPNWRLQIFRVRAPCRWTDEFEWHRTGAVVSLRGSLWP